MNRSVLGRLVDNVGALVLRQAFTWCLTFVLILHLPRYLGDTGFGMVTFATAALPVLLIVTEFGVGTYLVKRIAIEPERWPELFWNAVWARLLVVGLILSVTIPAIFLVFSGELRHLLLLTCGTLAVLSLAKTQEFAIQGLERMRWLTVAEIANKGAVAGFGIGLLAAGHGVVTYGAVVLLGAAIQLTLNTVPLVRLGLRAPRVRAPVVRMMFLGGLPFFLAGVIRHFYTFIDVAALQVLVPQEVVGWYGAAMQLGNTLNFFPLILTTAMLPLMSRFHADGGWDAFLAFARRGSSYAFMLALPVGVGLAVSAPAIIRLLGYPAGFDNSVPVLMILGLALIPAGQLMMLYMLVTATNRQNEWVGLIAAAAAIGLVLNLALIPLAHHLTGNGGIGAAAATLAAECIQLLMALRLMPEGLIDQRVALQAGQAMFAVALMALVVAGLQLVFGAPIYVFVPAGALTYAGLLFLTGAVQPSEIRELLHNWASSRRVGLQPDASASAPVSERGLP